MTFCRIPTMSSRHRVNVVDFREENIQDDGSVPMDPRFSSCSTRHGKVVKQVVCQCQVLTSW